MTILLNTPDLLIISTVIIILSIIWKGQKNG